MTKIELALSKTKPKEKENAADTISIRVDPSAAVLTNSGETKTNCIDNLQEQKAEYFKAPANDPSHYKINCIATRMSAFLCTV